MFCLIGECWSGPDVAETYNKDGPSEKCFTKGSMQKCNVNDNVECVGDLNTNFVYGINVKGKKDSELQYFKLPYFDLLVILGAIHSTKISGNFGPKLNGSVWSNRKSSKKRVHLLRWITFPGRTGWNFG